MPEGRRDRPARWRATAILFSIASTVGASPVQGPDSRDRLTASIEAILAEEALVGATWALVTPEGTTVGAAGLNDASRQQPMSPDDRVQVGSVAKTLLATVVLQPVTQGRIDLDAPLARYLPEVPIENPAGPGVAAAGAPPARPHRRPRRRTDVAGVLAASRPGRAPLRDRHALRAPPSRSTFGQRASSRPPPRTWRASRALSLATDWWVVTCSWTAPCCEACRSRP